MPVSQARIVIIGGGAIGMSIAYHLVRAGERDVLVLEKAQLTHGSTWHAAGLVGQLRSKKNLTRLMQNSVAVFDRLETETGQAIDWRKSGSLRIASSRERLAEIRRSLTQAKGFGFEAYEIGAEEAQTRFPWMTADGVIGAAWIPSDGYIDPYSLTSAYAKAARMGGVTIREGVLVTGFELDGRRVTGVATDHGSIACEIVVNAAGIWAKRVGEMAGVAIAAGAVEHQYVVTEKKIDTTPQTPTFRDPDRIFYLKPDVSAFAIGGWEKGAPACWTAGVPFDFARELLPENFDRFAPIMLGAAERMPVLNEVGIQTLINGPIPVSADGEPIMGLTPELDNFFVACGFTAGIAASGGAGEAMSRWILDGDPGMDLWPFDVRRFSAQQANRTYLAERSSESYGQYYAIHWPAEELHSARGARRSPIHAALLARGAVYGSKAGWERPLWFDTGEVAASETPSFEGTPGWFETVGREHRAARESAALFDQTSFSKFEVSGPGALGALQRIAANDLDRPDGTCIYTQLCNERGGIEADITIMRLAPDRFYLVTGSQFGVRDSAWIRKHLPGDAGQSHVRHIHHPHSEAPARRVGTASKEPPESTGNTVVRGSRLAPLAPHHEGDWSAPHAITLRADGSTSIRDVTSAYSVLNLVGPRSRAILQATTDDDVSNAAFPYLAVRTIEVGLASVRAARVGYVGELGWELHVPSEHMGHVYERLMEAGAEHRLIDAGYRAIESLRLEKGYVYWSAEVTPDTNPYEAGLGFAVALGKGDFIGRDALTRIRAEGPARKLSTLTVDGFAPLIGGEAILLDGEVVGTTTSAGFGYTVGQTIALGYLPAGLNESGPLSIEAYGKSYPAARGRRSLYDPKGERLRS